MLETPTRQVRRNEVYRTDQAEPGSSHGNRLSVDDRGYPWTAA